VRRKEAREEQDALVVGAGGGETRGVGKVGANEVRANLRVFSSSVLPIESGKRRVVVVGASGQRGLLVNRELVRSF
jgi:hypothetical protein